MKKLLSLMLTVGLLASLSASAFASSDAGDTTEPSRVDNVAAEALDASVKVTWDAATDNVAVTGYQVHYGPVSVTEEGQVYDSFEDVGDVLEYTVTGLDNDVQYFFSVIAYDAVGNESNEWSFEAEATPVAGAEAPADEEAPRVNNAEAVNMETVLVTFSEAVSVEGLDAQDVFVIENQDTFEELAVASAELDMDDATGMTVMLMTDPQEAGSNYELTVGVDLRDLAGNPMISGTSDTALFVGSDVEKEAEAPELTLSGVAASRANTVTLTFSGPVDLDVDPNVNFELYEAANPGNVLEIVAMRLESENVVMLSTGPQMDTDYTVMIKGLLSEDVSMDFTGMPGEEDDPVVEEPVVAPKDVANFLATKMREADNYMVKLSWQLVHDANANIVAQTLYSSTDRGSVYSQIAALDPAATEYEMNNLKAGEYWFKLTQTNAEGVESEGSVTKVVLAETGPEMLGLLLMSVGAGGIYRRKRK